jgi:effector-binding domain-containing protein
MTYKIRESDEPARQLAVTRFTTRPHEVDVHMAKAFGTVYGYLGRHRIEPIGAPIGCYRMVDDHTWEVRVGCEVAAPIADGEGMESFLLPARHTLTTVHVGPYDELPKAYDALETRAHELGVELDPGTMWEQYLSGPDVPDAEQHTVVHWPVLPR